MSYEYPIDVANLWEERAPQFVNLGIPEEEVDRLVATVDDMWRDGPGGWCFEWSALGERYAAAGQHRLAATAFGGARFPCLADDAKRAAHRRQVDEYVLAAADLPLDFERRTVTCRLGGEVVEVPVHILAAPDATADTPVLVATGGIDTWKMDLHAMWAFYIEHAGVRIVACDIPGTGELSHVAMGPETAEILDGVVAFARTLTTGKVGQLGMSFGGWFSAHAGLTEVVDAAVVVGGPITHAFGPSNMEGLLYGMKDIFANACGFAAPPTLDELLAAAARFAMDDVLARNTNSPMLAINGDQDVHVPITDTQLFEGRADVQLIHGAGHCAFDRLDILMPACAAWLTRQLS